MNGDDGLCFFRAELLLRVSEEKQERKELKENDNLCSTLPSASGATHALIPVTLHHVSATLPGHHPLTIRMHHSHTSVHMTSLRGIN